MHATRLQHVLRKEDDDWVKKCMEYEVEGSRPRGTPKRTLTGQLYMFWYSTYHVYSVVLMILNLLIH